MTTNPTTLPLFDFEPDWSPNLKVSLRYPSNIATAPHGDQQRELLSTVPIRALKFTVKTETLTEARRLQQFMRYNIGSKIVTPIWPDAVAVTATASGSTVPVVETQLREFATNGWALIWSCDEAVSCELFQIASVGTTSFGVSGAGLAGTYAAGSLVVPIMVARFSGSSTEANWRHADASASAVEVAECIEESLPYSPIIPSTFTWSPLDIAGTKRLWLDDSRLAGPDGEAIAQWQDRSGSGYHMSQSETGLRPVIKKNILGSRSVARFDGVDDYLMSAEDMRWIQSMLLVGRKSDSHSPFGEFGAGWHRGFFGWNYPGYDWFTNNYRNGNPGNPSDWQSDFAQNVLVGTEAADPTIDTQWFRIGHGWPDYSYLNGDIACIVAYDSVLDTTNRQKLEGWAAWTYGLQALLPSDHPYKSAVP